MYVERSFVQRVKSNYKVIQVQNVSSVVGLALIYLLMYYFQENVQFIIVWPNFPQILAFCYLN